MLGPAVYPVGSATRLQKPPLLPFLAVSAMRSIAALLIAASSPAQIYTTDAAVASPELVHVKERVDWLQRDRGEDLRAATTLVWSPARWLETDLTVPFVH